MGRRFFYGVFLDFQANILEDVYRLYVSFDGCMRFTRLFDPIMSTAISVLDQNIKVDTSNNP